MAGLFQGIFQFPQAFKPGFYCPTQGPFTALGPLFPQARRRTRIPKAGHTKPKKRVPRDPGRAQADVPFLFKGLGPNKQERHRGSQPRGHTTHVEFQFFRAIFPSLWQDLPQAQGPTPRSIVGLQTESLLGAGRAGLGSPNFSPFGGFWGPQFALPTFLQALGTRSYKAWEDNSSDSRDSAGTHRGNLHSAADLIPPVPRGELHKKGHLGDTGGAPLLPGVKHKRSFGHTNSFDQQALCICGGNTRGRPFLNPAEVSPLR